MFRVTSHYITAAVVSGLLTWFAVAQVHFLLAWVFCIPLFSVLVNGSGQKAFRAGLVFGITLSLLSFYWMIPGAQRFTGSSIIYGVMVFLLSVLVLSFYFALINRLFVWLRSGGKTIMHWIKDALLIAAIYTAGEALFMVLTSGMPWFGFHSGNGLMENNYSLQPAAVFGMHILSFMAIIVNYLFALIIAGKRWKLAWLPLTIVLVYMGWGYLLLQLFGHETKNSTVKVSLVNENVRPEIKWDDNNGNRLVASLLRLDSLAALQKPDMIIWSESAIPWTFRPDDDLVKELLRLSAPSRATHLLGMNTDYAENYVYNSVYAIKPDGTVQGRYDKYYLLSFIEASVAGIAFPFFSSNGFMVKQAAGREPLTTNYGNAGVMICNESVLPQAAAEHVQKGADFLVNVSNDGWFADSYLADLHFWNTKLRAVETRRDIAVCSNNGYTGLVHASGEVALQRRATEPFVDTVQLDTYGTRSFAASMPYLFVYLCAGYILVSVILNIKSITKRA